MGYKQKYNSVAPMTTSNKAAKLGHTSSAIGMQTDDGVVVTGDASKIGGKTTMTEAEKKREELKKRIEARKIRQANEKMERKMKAETTRAEIGKRRIAREQEKRKKEGKDYIDPKSGKVVRRGKSPAQQRDPKSNNDPYSRAAANDKVFADAKKAQYSRKNKKHAGSNFFPPQNPRPKSELQKGKTFDTDVASLAYDVDQDGDSVFRDYNQDGTMLGRAIKKLFG